MQNHATYTICPNLDVSSVGQRGNKIPIKTVKNVDSSKNEKSVAIKETAKVIDCMARSSPFFETRVSKSLPYFSPEGKTNKLYLRNGEAVSLLLRIFAEIKLGFILGEGEFGTVREVTEVTLMGSFEELKSKDSSYRDLMSSAAFEALLKRLRALSSEEATEGSIGELDKSRIAMKEMSFRDGKGRYAVKRVREDLQGEQMVFAAMDLATEAMFLSTLSHPNIVRLRGAAGVPGHPSFMVIMDRLYLTMDEKIQIWQADTPLANGGCFGCGSSPDAYNDDVVERIVVGYDAARAVSFLHQNNIVYRDLKPTNFGFDVRGNLRLFDFGIAKELKTADLVEGDQYNLTPATGSRRWMAPEVCLGKPYGLQADVYGFGLLLCFLCSLELPFGEKISPVNHMTLVVRGGRRPSVPSFLPKTIRQTIAKCWDPDFSKRPKMESVCKVLGDEIAVFQRMKRPSILDRTLHLRAFSNRSFRNALMKAGLDSTDQKLGKMELTETDISVERAALKRICFSRDPESLKQTEEWTKHTLFGSALGVKMPKSWEDIVWSLKDAQTHKELWQDGDSRILLKLEILRVVTDEESPEAAMSSYITAMAGANGASSEPLDFRLVEVDLRTEMLPACANLALGKARLRFHYRQAPTASVSLEICLLRFVSKGSDLVITFVSNELITDSTEVDAGAGLSDTFSRFLANLRFDDLNIFGADAAYVI